MILFLIGILVGIVIAAPMGPVGVLCVRKTIEYGFMGTLAVALGTALADGFYAGLAAFGLATISEFLLVHVKYFKLIGGSLLLVLAIREYFSKTQVREAIKISPRNYLALTTTTCLITLLNPIGIVSFIGIFAILSDKLSLTHHTIWIVIGVFVGSLLWFLLLGRMIQHTHQFLPEKMVLSIRKISAIMFAIFGAWALLSLL